MEYFRELVAPDSLNSQWWVLTLPLPQFQWILFLMWKKVRVFEFDSDKNSILCLTHSFSISPLSRFYIFFN